MNLLAAPMLYVLPEADAYCAFRHLVVHHCPRYVTKMLVGAHDGAKLTDATRIFFERMVSTSLLDPTFHLQLHH